MPRGNRRHALSGALAALLALVSLETACAGGAPATRRAAATPPSKPSAAVNAKRPAFDFARAVGMVEGDRPDSLWLMIADSTLAAGDSLTLIADEPEPDPSSPPAILTAAVAERLPSERTFKTRVKFVEEPGDVFYRLVAPAGALDCCIFGYAVRAARSQFRVVGGRAEADLDGDGVSEHFQSCASREGLHPAVWSGEPNQRPHRWSRYYFLGYDLEPTCAEPDGATSKP